MDKEQLVEILENAGFEPRSYSGRGMYDKECVAISCEGELEAVLEIIDSTYLSHLDDLFVELLEVLRDTRVDTLGRREIMYWPQIRWED
jgi:hypothetical protein